MSGLLALLLGVERLGWAGPAEMLHHLAVATGPGEWFATAGVSGVLGVAVGALLILSVRYGSGVLSSKDM
jgi:hypothetical protein